MTIEDLKFSILFLLEVELCYSILYGLVWKWFFDVTLELLNWTWQEILLMSVTWFMLDLIINEKRKSCSTLFMNY